MGTPRTFQFPMAAGVTPSSLDNSERPPTISAASSTALGVFNMERD